MDAKGVSGHFCLDRTPSIAIWSICLTTFSIFRRLEAYWTSIGPLLMQKYKPVQVSGQGYIYIYIYK